MTINIAVIGECMIELSIKDKITTRGFGGDTLNTSVYLSRLFTDNQAAIYYVTGLGVDPFSQEMLNQWQKENIKTNLIQQMDNKMPGLYAIVTDSHGERSFYYWRNDAAAKFWLQTEQTQQICKTITKFDYIYLSGISVAILDEYSIDKLIELLETFKANGGKVIFDNNYRPRLWRSQEYAQNVYSKILSYTDIAFLTQEDEYLLWGNDNYEDSIVRSRKLGVNEIIIKRGSESCIVATANDRVEVPANIIAKQKIVDTTAAGDSFSAGYLSIRLLGGSIKAAIKQGHDLAATVIQYSGAIIPYEAMSNLISV